MPFNSCYILWIQWINCHNICTYNAKAIYNSMNEPYRCFTISMSGHTTYAFLLLMVIVLKIMSRSLSNFADMLVMHCINMSAEQLFWLPFYTCGGTTYAVLPLLLSVLKIMNGISQKWACCRFNWWLFGIGLLYVFWVVSLEAPPNIHLYIFTSIEYSAQNNILFSVRICFY